MGEDMHDRIAERFVGSGAVNFEAAGKFLAEIGPELTLRDTGLHGFAFGSSTCSRASSARTTWVGSSRTWATWRR